MGLDLALLPFENGDNFSHSIVQVPRDRQLFKMIESVPSQPVADGFKSYLCRAGDKPPHYGETVQNAYGYPLECTRAEHLKPIITSGPEGAFVAALADDHRIALYWR